MTWLPRAMHVLRDELKNIEVTVSSDYSPDLAEALVRGRLDLAFLRVEPAYDLGYEVVDREPLIVLMPSDHRLTAKQAIHPREFVGEIFIGGANKATVLRAVTEDYLRRSGVDIKLDHGVDNMAMAMSLVASTRGLALMPAYARNLLPSSVVSRPLEGEAPTIDVAVGYSTSNTSPILKLFLSRLDELKGPDERVGSQTLGAYELARRSVDVVRHRHLQSAPSEFRCRRLQNLVGQRGIVDGARQDECSDKTGHRSQRLFTSGGL